MGGAGSAARWWVVRAVAVVAAVVWGVGLMARWYTSTRVDLDPEVVRGLVGVTVLGPLAGVAVAAVRRRPLHPLLAVGLLVSTVPGIVILFFWPRVLEASNTDTRFVLGAGPRTLTASVVVAAIALAIATGPVRRRAAAYPG